MPRRIPPDVARVVESFDRIGRAARKALWLSERAAEQEIREAARRAQMLTRRLRGG